MECLAGINLGALAVAWIGAVATAVALYRVPMPTQPVLVAGCFVLGAAATFGVGLVVAARSSGGREPTWLSRAPADH